MKNRADIVDKIQNYAKKHSSDPNEQLTLLAAAYADFCEEYGLQREGAVEVLNDIFDQFERFEEKLLTNILDVFGDPSTSGGVH
jgi:hypothetical protein